MKNFPTGKRVLISELSENPLEGVEKNLQIVDQDSPDPESLKDTDVIVLIESAAVGWVDLLMLSGQYQHMPPMPYTPGLEYSGTIIWKGSEVKPFSLDERVLVDGFSSGPRSPGDYQQYGGFASYAVAPQEAVMPIPDNFNFDEASSLLGSYETAYHCLVTCAKLQAGETILIHGASGSTGLAAVHMAKLIGATVIATGRNDDKLKTVKQQGADYVVNCAEEDGKGIRKFRDDIKTLTGGQGVDVVYDGVGGDISLESLRCVKFAARFLIVGWASTPFVAKGKGQRGAQNANMLPTNLIMMKGLQVLGCPTVISAQNDASLRPIRLKQIMEWVEEHDLRPYVSHKFELNQVKEAMKAKWDGKITGGCVLKPPLSQR